MHIVHAMIFEHFKQGQNLGGGGGELILPDKQGVAEVVPDGRKSKRKVEL